MFRFIPDKPGGDSDSDYASTLSPSVPVLSCLLRLLTMTGVGALSPFGAVFLFQGKFSQWEEAVRPLVRPLPGVPAAGLSLLVSPSLGSSLKGRWTHKTHLGTAFGRI